jgi:hypothetical protein
VLVRDVDGAKLFGGVLVINNLKYSLRVRKKIENILLNILRYVSKYAQSLRENA